jgi:hypothetical protein
MVKLFGRTDEKISIFTQDKYTIETLFIKGIKKDDRHYATVTGTISGFTGSNYSL